MARRVVPSFAQERMWFLERWAPGSAQYNRPQAWRLEGRLDVDALRRALDQVVVRHEVLRTTFGSDGGSLVASAAPAPAIELPVVDLRGRAEGEREGELARLVGEEIRAGFDLEAGPLLRARLWRLRDGEHVFALTQHHIVTDGWSAGVLWGELSALYAAFCRAEASPLPTLPIQYADYAMWQRQRLSGDRLQAEVRHWRQALAGMPALDLPTDRARPAVSSYRGERVGFELPASLTGELKALARRERATLFMVLLAGFEVLLSRHSGQDDFGIGVPIAGRTRQELEGLVGLFVNTLVMRARLQGAPSFRELVGRVRAVALGAYEHQELPFEKLVEEINPPRDLSRNPLFQASFALRNLPRQEPALSGLAVSDFALPATSVKFDLTMELQEAGEVLRGSLTYASELFDRPTATLMAAQFEALLAAAVASPDRPVQELSTLTEFDRRVLADPSRPLHQPAHSPVPKTVLEQATRSPAASAVEQGDRRWSYAELAGAARSVAGALAALGVGKGERIALTGPRSFGLVCAWLGAWMAGAVVVPVDPSLPTLRQRSILRAAAARRVLRVGAARPWQPAGDDDLSIVGIDADSGRVDGWTGADTAAGDGVALSGDDPAYVFFTSGSTGEPKGVLGVHKGLGHFLDWQRAAFGIGPGDRVAQLTHLSFDPVLRDVFLPLTSGATLVLPADDDLVDVPAWLARSRLTVVHAVPTVAKGWLPLQGSAAVPDLRWIFFAGEPLTGSFVERWRELVRGTYGVVNLYGPTETTLVKFFFVVPEPAMPGVQPAGVPLPDTQGLILRGNTRCAAGEVGEIVIRTPFRTLGYINAPREQSQHFVPNPLGADASELVYRTGDTGRYRADGLLQIIGRLDDQAKVNGVRVEPAEIEAVLERHGSVREAAVGVVVDARGEKSLAAYVVAAPGSAPSPADLRDWLARHLPRAIRPATVSFVERIERLPNGKVNRRALPTPSSDDRFPAGAATAAPRSEVEARLVGIFSAVLGIEAARIGVDDDFFDLGGHSLRAMQVLARIRADFGVPVAPREFFDAPTVAGCARRVAVASACGGDQRAAEGITAVAAPPIARLARRAAPA